MGGGSRGVGGAERVGLLLLRRSECTRKDGTGPQRGLIGFFFFFFRGGRELSVRKKVKSSSRLQLYPWEPLELQGRR